jgi:hypothetical protein
MPGPRLLPAQAEALDQAQHPGLGVGHAEAVLGQPAEVTDAPLGTTVAPGVGAAQDQRPQGRLPALVEGAGAARAGTVAQAGHARLVVAVNPVAERLAGHAGEPRRFLAGYAFQRVGEREQPGAHPAGALMAGQPAQLGRAPVVADRQGGGHGGASG